MIVDDIYIKTSLGVEEVQTRKLHLAPRLRTMLIMIDGHKSVSTLKVDANKFGCPENFIESLETAGLIAKTGAASPNKNVVITPTAPTHSASVSTSLSENPIVDEFERFRVAKDFMISCAVNSLGMKAFFFTLKLERAGTVDDLRGLVKPFSDAIAKATSAAQAEALTRQLQEYLG